MSPCERDHQGPPEDHRGPPKGHEVRGVTPYALKCRGPVRGTEIARQQHIGAPLRPELHPEDPLSAPPSLLLSLEPELAARLAKAAEGSGLAPADIALRALRHHLDGVTAYARVSDDLALIKGALADLAGAVGEALAEPEPGAVDSICRYRPSKA